MVLVDTSVWIEHLRRGSPTLGALLTETAVLVHPFIVGELACGNLKNRAVILSNLNELPAAPMASQEEALALVERHGLAGRGIGWVDVHLLASALLSGCRFWTFDSRLSRAARDVGLKSLQNGMRP